MEGEAKLVLRELLEAVLVQVISTFFAVYILTVFLAQELKQAHGSQLWRQSVAIKPAARSVQNQIKNKFYSVVLTLNFKENF